MTSTESLVRFAAEALGAEDYRTLQLVPLTARGSDRSFFRLTGNASQSYIAIHYDPARMENSYYAAITEFLSGIGIPVPELIGHDVESHFMLMEDLGNTDLWSFRNEPWDVKHGLYEKTLAVAARLHSFPAKDFPSHRVKLMEEFSPRLYHWERDYFRENFVALACGIEPGREFAVKLEEELSALAGRLLATGPCLVHRDFQSQNVMIRDGKPYLIDYQGMRLGSPFYDLASMLSDPYVALSTPEIRELLHYYHEISGSQMDRMAFEDLFWDASAERLMQALGAYGFLGIRKGLAPFLAHIPAGIVNLRRALSHASLLPCLGELMESCGKTWFSSHPETSPRS